MSAYVQLFALIDHRSRLGIGDQRFYRHGLDDAHVLILYFFTRCNRFAGNTVSIAGHLGAIVNLVPHANPVDPLSRNRGWPASGYQA